LKKKTVEEMNIEEDVEQEPEEEVEWCLTNYLKMKIVPDDLGPG